MFPGKAQWRGGEAWGGADWSERFDALGGSDGGFDGAQRAWSARRQTGMSGRVLGCWRSLTHVARAAPGLGVLVERGARGTLSAWSQRGLAWPGHMIQWLALLEAGLGSGGRVLASSQTRLARLVWPLARRRQRGGKFALGLLTIDS